MNINQERFTTYKSLSPVLTTQTTCIYMLTGKLDYTKVGLPTWCEK